MNSVFSADILQWLYGADNALNYTSVRRWAEDIMATEVGIELGQDTVADLFRCDACET